MTLYVDVLDDVLFLSFEEDMFNSFLGLFDHGKGTGNFASYLAD